MRRLVLALLVLLPCSSSDAAATTGAAVPITLGQSLVRLYGPWRFHVGDDPRWADPGFDDSDWETVDLTPLPGATDGDVGLTGYVPGWSKKGHPGYLGYAWYRIRLAVRSSGAERPALLGPWDVDSVYEVYANGTLLGGVGDFSGEAPTAHASRYPRRFELPPAADGDGSLVVAIRVWLGPWGAVPGAGGIHIAPAIGAPDAVAAQVRLQWLTIFEGYAVDVVPATLFVLLAVMVLCLRPFDRGNRAYPWLASALVLSAILRGNQSFFSWFEIETIQAYVIVIMGLAGSLALGAWMMAWRNWFGVERPAWLPRAIAAQTIVLIFAQWLARPWLFHGAFPPAVIAVIRDVITGVRLSFLVTFVWIVYRALRRASRESLYALPAVLAIGGVLFASELSAIHVPGIWFPFGIGVSLSEILSVVFAVCFFVVLVGRLRSYARRAREDG